MSGADRRLGGGVAYALAAYLMWALFPLYFRALRSVPPLEILAHRMLWSLVLLALVLSVRRDWGWFAAARRDPAVLGRFVASASLLAFNWGTYIWAVNNGHVIDASLGYYVNPLMSVLLGALVVGERLRLAQWSAVALASIGVIFMSVQIGRPPWIALGLAVSFGLYGLLRKTASLGSLEGLTLETLLQTPFAIAFLAWQWHQGHDAFLEGGWSLRGLLLCAGPVTAVPLLLFASAARRIPLSLLGFLQYSMPTVVLALGVWLFHEPFGADRAVGFALVWSAVALYLGDTLVRLRRTGAAA